MSKRFGLMGLATVESEYLGGGARLTCSDRTAADVDTEIMETLKECYEEAKKLLSGNRELMDKLAAHLIEKETISGKEFMKIYRKEKGIPEPVGDDKEGEDQTGKEKVKSMETAPVETEENSGNSTDKGDTLPENEKAGNSNDFSGAENHAAGRFSNAPSDFFRSGKFPE